MSAAVMAERRAAEASPRIKARMAGVLYLLEGLPAVFQQVVISRLIVSGDAAATAANVQANELLFRVWFAAALLAVAFHIAYTVLFYDLFRPVNRTIALLAAAVSLVACALQASAALFQLAPLLVLGGGSSMGALTPGQVQALALLFFNLHTQAFNIYLIFFGFWLIPTVMAGSLNAAELCDGPCSYPDQSVVGAACAPGGPDIPTRRTSAAPPAVRVTRRPAARAEDAIAITSLRTYSGPAARAPPG